MTNQTPFQTVVNALLEKSKPFPKKYLSLFSDIDPASLSLLLGAWPQISLARKRTLLADLATLLDKDTIVSFDDLARNLLSDPDAAVRVGAMRLLTECEDTKLVPVYEQILANDPDAAARAQAAELLGLFVDMGELDEIPEHVHHQVEDSLLAAVHDKDAIVRHKVLEALGYSSRREVPPLIEAAYQREDPAWVTSALVAMGRSGDERWSEQVVRMILNDDRAMRLAAVKAAGELGLAAARLPILRLLDEEDDNQIFYAAILSISQIGGEDVQTYLQNLIDQTDDEDEIEFLEDALVNLAFTEDLEHFELLVLDPDEDLHEIDTDAKDEE